MQTRNVFRLAGAVASFFALHLPVLVLAQALPLPGDLAVLHDAWYQAAISFVPQAGGASSVTWAMTGSMGRGLALRYDSEGRLRDAFMTLPRIAGPWHTEPGSLVRYDPASSSLATVATYPNGSPRGAAADTDGNILVAVSNVTGTLPNEAEAGGYVLRLASNDLSASETIWSDGARIPWAIAVQPDGRILVGWNGDSMNNSGNGITLVDPSNQTPAVDISLRSQPYSCPILTSLAIAPGGRLYVAEHPMAFGQWSGTVSYIAPDANRVRIAVPSSPTVPHELGYPEQLAIAGTEDAHTIYVADATFRCAFVGGPGGPGGGGGGGGGNCYLGFGALVAFDMTAAGPASSRQIQVSSMNNGPFGVAVVGGTVSTRPVDAATGLAPVTLTFDGVSAPGTTTLEMTPGPSPLAGFKLGDPPTYYDISSTVGFSGSITVCIDYSGVNYVDESQLKLYHWNGSVWEELPNQTLDTGANTLCGRTTSLSPFAILEPAPLDTEGPALSIALSRTTLWPPNGKLVQVQLTGSVYDESGVATLTYEVSDEYGALSTASPVSFTSFPVTLGLEASRTGMDLNGRLYTIVVKATDSYGNVSMETLYAKVPHDQR